MTSNIQNENSDEQHDIESSQHLMNTKPVEAKKNVILTNDESDDPDAENTPIIGGKKLKVTVL